MALTDAQWSAIQEFFPQKDDRSPGRPRRDPREVLDGVLWICRTGAPWKDLPNKFPPYQTCHRYFQHWNQEGIWNKILFRLAEDLKDRGKIDITECFIDGTFSSAKKGGIILEKLSEARAPRSWPSRTLLVFLSPYGPEQPTITK